MARSWRNGGNYDQAMAAPEPSARELLAPRWRGQPGRLEVWYATFSDTRTGNGLWLHHEVVAPTDGARDAPAGASSSHEVAWAASFPVDGEPRWSHTEVITLGATGSAGSAGDLEWDLSWDLDDAEPLYTFPRWAWHRELLPGSQVVAAPRLSVHGTVGGADFEGVGGLSRIYGHGNAERWAWLHADLGGGDVLELVTAVSTRAGLSLLPPITHLRYRIDGVTGPSLAGPSLRLRTRLGLPDWSVVGWIGRRRVNIEVHQPPARSVSIPYADPDGRTATCVNTELADATIRIGERRWQLDGTAHAEVGSRP